MSGIIAVLFIWFDSYIRRLAKQIADENDDHAIVQEFPQLLPILETVIQLRKKYTDEVNRVEQLLAVSPFADVIDACPVAMVAVDRDCIIRAYNEAYMSLIKDLRQEKSKLIGISIAEVRDETGITLKERLFANVFKGTSVKDKQINILGRKWLASANPLWDKESGEVNGGIAVFYEITEYEYLREEIRRLDRLNIVGEMAASVAHEIRNPMTTVRGYLQFMARKNESVESYEMLISELDRANELIEEYLSLARNKPVEKKLSNINDIVHSIYLLLNADTLKQGILLKLELEPDLPALLLNEKEIRQLILNLYRNAEDAIDGKGSIVIRTRKDGEYICLDVEDTGCGIAVSCLEKVMRPFYTTKRSGTGMGLSVCRNIAERHNGQILINSVINQGTTVTVCFNLKKIEICDDL
ncbi:MAG TPA: ATP-binding protein [Methylomusa anaerophila]|nr:ATP-binding protein [Methylomusa anaerophila]HML88832.1 ATP-binding protein [Methylomusa anaerophila]